MSTSDADDDGPGPCIEDSLCVCGHWHEEHWSDRHVDEPGCGACMCEAFVFSVDFNTPHEISLRMLLHAYVYDHGKHVACQCAYCLWIHPEKKIQRYMQWKKDNKR